MQSASASAPSNEVSVSNQRSVGKRRKTSYRFPSPKITNMGKPAKVSKGPAKKIMTKED